MVATTADEETLTKRIVPRSPDWRLQSRRCQQLARTSALDRTSPHCFASGVYSAPSGVSWHLLYLPLGDVNVTRWFSLGNLSSV